MNLENARPKINKSQAFFKQLVISLRNAVLQHLVNDNGFQKKPDTLTKKKNHQNSLDVITFV